MLYQDLGRIWDNDGRSFDRYTVELYAEDGSTYFLGIGDTGNTPNGFCMVVDARPGAHLGREVGLADITPAAQRAVMSELAMDWANA